ncbi:VOC family protein [uncultured Friedmanniella sp.]|uniref:VOC family protein n=1 Tax=uncultured Friedmanniella sp. TaxID=335381 RepID=UPI0035CAE764
MSPVEGVAGRLRYQDLCLDAVDAALAARFWSAALGLTAERRGDLYRLHDDDPAHTLWVNAVPEPQTVKQRVHLDLLVGSVGDLVGLGAEVTRELPHWTLMRDPEGGELCAFVRPADQLPRYRLYELVVDAADPERIAAWWADRFGVPVQRDTEQGFCWLEGVPGMPWELVFQAVPEAKQVKNRVHWDVCGDPADAVAAGARLLRTRDDEIAWDVLADPDGNEFCVFAPPG